MNQGLGAERDDRLGDAPGVPLPDVVWSLAKPHRVGTVCGTTCPQCGDGKLMTWGPNGEILEPTPSFLIVAEATVEDWLRSTLRRGAINPPIIPNRYYYFVLAD